MKKSLYYIDEEEKRRILNLHESRTKKQYLVNEQLMNYAQPKAKEKNIYEYSKAVEKAKDIISNMGITVDNLDITIDNGDLVITGSAYENDKKRIEDKFSEDLFDGIGTSVNLQVKEGSTVGWENYPCVTDSGVIPEQYLDDHYGNTSKYSIKLADNTTGIFFQDGTYTVGENQEKKNYKCDGNNIVDKDNNTVLFKSQNTTDDASKTGGNTSGGNTTGGKIGGSAGGGTQYQKYPFGWVVPNTIKPDVLASVREKIGNKEQTETPGTLSQNDINLLYKFIEKL